MSCSECNALRKALHETKLPEGAFVSYNGITAVVGRDGRLIPETRRIEKSADGRSDFSRALDVLANEKTPGGALPSGASGEIVFGG